ncbi:MAG: hypothetical protein NC453_20520 [Muribaculum sp.]|nr:hypothetical protein [Muribaculum sp.]
MGYNTTPEYETAQSRISTLMAEIGEQLTAINNSTDVDSVVAEQDKSGFIAKQSELIVNYQVREENDERDAYIAELEAQIKKAKSQEDYYRNLWYKESEKTKHLKAAINSLTAVLNED